MASEHRGGSRGLGRGGYALLAAMTALSPLTNVFILPGLPEIAAALDTTVAAAQFALSVSFAGLAVGLLIVGPLSDAYGRRIPVTTGLVVYVVTTVLCAFAPDISLLVLGRFLQGVAGGAVWVIARAIVRDVFHARASARAFSQLAMITGLAPVVAPLIAGQILLLTDWRGLIVALAIVGAAIATFTILFLRETLPRERRHRTGFIGQRRTMGALVRSPYFATFLGLAILQSTTHFTFVIMSPVVFHQDYGFTAQSFAVLYAGAAACMVVGNQTNALLVRRLSPVTLLRAQLWITVAGAVAFLAAILLRAPLPLVIAAMMLIPLASGATNSNITALGLAPYPHAAGAAAALLGASSSVIGAFVPPLVSLISVGAMTMAVTMVGASIVALILALSTHRRLRPVFAAAMSDDAAESGGGVAVPVASAAGSDPSASDVSAEK